MAGAEVNQPKTGTAEAPVWYTFNTPYRNSLYPTSKGEGQALMGEQAAGRTATWRFEARTDGSFNIVNAADNLYISPAAANNTALTTVATEPVELQHRRRQGG